MANTSLVFEDPIPLLIAYKERTTVEESEKTLLLGKELYQRIATLPAEVLRNEYNVKPEILKRFPHLGELEVLDPACFDMYCSGSRHLFHASIERFANLRHRFVLGEITVEDIRNGMVLNTFGEKT